jgi:hypothetical protein
MSNNKSSSLFKNCHLEKVVVYTTRSGRAVRAPKPVYVPQEFIARDDYSDESEDDSEDVSIDSDSDSDDHIVELEVVAPKRRRLIPVVESDDDVSEDDSVHTSDEEFLNDDESDDENDVTESEETATLSESDDESDDEDIEDLLESDDDEEVSDDDSESDDSDNEEMLNVSIRRNGKVRYSYQNQRIPIPDDEDDIVVNYK